MKVVCWILFLTVVACQGRKQNIEDKPDAVRDLLIDRSFWQPHPQGGMAGFHRFTITNTSQHYGYQHIKIRFDYYDQDYRKIDSAMRIVERAVEPRSAIKIDTLETKLVKEGATTATATIVNASAD